MPTRRETAESVRKTAELVALVERRLEMMQTVLMVREPSSTLAADAYDGLRKQIIGSVQERLAHLSQLVQLDAAVTSGADPDTLRTLLDGWFEASGLHRATDPATDDFELLFDVLEDLGGPTVVVEPAYVDTATGRVIRRGRARRTEPVAPLGPRPAPTVGAALADTVSADERG